MLSQGILEYEYRVKVIQHVVKATKGEKNYENESRTNNGAIG